MFLVTTHHQQDELPGQRMLFVSLGLRVCIGTYMNIVYNCKYLIVYYLYIYIYIYIYVLIFLYKFNQNVKQISKKATVELF